MPIENAATEQRASVTPASPLGVVVRASDGSFRVWQDGEWRLLAAAPTVAAPGKPTFSGPNAASYFSADEEQEARKLAQRLDTAPEHKRYSLDKIISQLQERAKVDVAAAAADAFRRAVLTFLRGTRGPVDFGAVLVRPVDKAGVGLTAAQSQTLVAILSVIGDKVRAEGGEVMDDPAPLSRPAAAFVPPVLSAKITPPVKPIPVVPALPRPAPIAPLAPPTPIRPILPRSAAVNDVRPAAAPTPRSAPVRRLVGPVDELRQMDLVTFRTMGATPADQANAVVAKVQALGRESLTRHAEGLAAWRESPVYTAYRTIGLQSIQQGKPVAQVVAELFRDGQPTLTEAEFNAVADANRRLRF
jgi:hypothetical protein